MLPSDVRQIADLYTFTRADLDLIARRRGEPNRLGFAIQLGSLRYPGRAWVPDELVPAPMLRFIADQVGIGMDRAAEYAVRDETRREHLAELIATFDWKTFGQREQREVSTWLLTPARGTDRGLVLVKALLEELRRRRILAPALAVLDRLASAVSHRARREAYRALTADLSAEQRARLDELLAPYPDSKPTHLGWLRQISGAPNPANILKAVERLAALRKLGIPGDWALRVRQDRLLQTAREGANADAPHLREFGEERRHATSVAVVIDTMATLTDQRHGP